MLLANDQCDSARDLNPRTSGRTLNKLETAAKEPTLYPRGLYMTRGQLTDTQKKAIQGATDQVNKTRSAAERARAFAPDRVDKNPPFTTGQLEALVIPETFPIIDWPKEFGVASTPLRRALEYTYLDSRFAPITLSF